MNLDRFIYEFNLMSTLTIKDTYEWAYVLNNKINKEVDYSNSINLYDFVDLFNKLYCYFKKDYEKLGRLNFGKNLEILRFNKWVGSNDGINYRKLIIYVDNPNKDICDDYDTLLYLYEKNGEVYSYITNNLLPWEESYYKKYLNLDNKLIKSYLDFADKYSLLIDGYDFFKNKSFLGREIASVFAKINGNLLNDLSTFEVSFGNLYFNYEDYINVIFKLGDSLEINYDDSKVIL